VGSGMDEAKGRIKEAVGDLTEDEDLKREGKLDQAGAAVKEKAENLGESLKETVGDMVDRAKDALGRDR